MVSAVRLILFSTLFVLLAFVGDVLMRSGHLKYLRAIDDGCTLVKGAFGAEDFVVTQFGHVLVSSDKRSWYRKPMTELPDDERMGGIFLLENQTLTQLPISNWKSAQETQFHPHGIDIRGQYLYVVGHTTNGEGIFIFDILTDSEGRPNGLYLQHVMRAQPTLFVALNAIAVLPVKREKDTVHHVLYITNWLGAGMNSPLHHVEMLGRLPWSYIIRCELWNRTGTFESHCEKAVVGGRMFNGITMADEKTLAVIEAGRMTVNLYTISDEQRIAQDPDQVLHMHSMGDNINVASDGALWLGGLPRALEFLAHSADPTHRKHRASSEAFYYARRSDGTYEPARTAVLHDGSLLSASSVAIPHGDKVLMGGVFDDGVMICPFNASTSIYSKEAYSFSEWLPTFLQ